MIYIKNKKEVAEQCDYYEHKKVLKEKGKIFQCFVSDFTFIVLL